MKRVFAFISAVLLMSHICGCAAFWVGAGAAGGASAAIWAQGKLKHSVDASLKQVLEATKVALIDLDCAIIKTVEKDDVAQVEGRYTDERKLWVDIHSISAKKSEIVIRVGVTGDADASRLILDKILSVL